MAIEPTQFSFPVGTSYHQPIICKNIDGTRVNLDGASSLFARFYNNPREGAAVVFTGTTSNCITEIDYSVGELLLNFETGDFTTARRYFYILSCTLSGGDPIILGEGEVYVTRGVPAG